jgi:hypothetical protein
MSSVTADFVSLNKNTGSVELIVTDAPMISDVIEIPDLVFEIPLPSNLSAPAPAPAPVPAPAPAPVPAPAPAPAPANMIITPTTIQHMNHSTLSDVMRNHTPVYVKVPSTVSTRVTDISSIHHHTHTDTNAGKSAPLKSSKSVTDHRKSTSSSSRMYRHMKHKSTKVILDDEYKDTSIDYDDDDPEIKKLKASLFNFVKDIAFNLIFTIPSLRTKLRPILNNPSLAINQIERIFDEFKDELNRVQLESIKRYVCVEGVRDKLNYILEAGFKKILADGKIDINDAPQFIQLVYFIIHSFNNINNGEVFKFAVSREHVMLLLHFILKSVFCLTLDGEEEQMAFGLVDTSFKLVKIEVCPLVSKRWYHKFRICRAKKVIEDLVD